MIRRIFFGLLALLAAAYAVTRINGDRYRGPVQQALESGLHRKVEIGKVGFRLLPTPALTVENVTIGEDPAIGREPIAYVTTLRAVPRLLSLISGPLQFSSVTLDEASLNISRTDRAEGGVLWNFASLARRDVLNAFPDVHLRTARINFKSGDAKSIFYLLDTDIDLWPPDRANGPWTVKIEGQPARTDRRAHGFGSFVARGQWLREGNALTIDARLEKSELSDMMTLFEGKQSGLQGTVQGNLHIAGPLSRAGIAGRLSVAELHGFNNPPPGGRPWVFDIGGAFNLPQDTLELRAVLGGKQPLLDVRYRLSEYLQRPRWGVTALLSDMPLDPLAPVVRNLGFGLPADLAISGTARGVVGWSVPSGIPQMNGAVRISSLALSAKGTPTLTVPVADLKFTGSSLSLQPTQLRNGDTETVNVEAAWDFSTLSGRASLSSEGMSVAAVRKAIAGAGIPVLSDATAGTWSGQLGYGEKGWTGNISLKDVDVPFEAFAAPLHLTHAEAQLTGTSIQIRKFTANVGAVEIQGEYRYDADGDSPHRFRVTLGEVDAATLEKLLQPTLRRGNLLTYAFNFGRAPQPDWLVGIKASGSVQAASLSLAGATYTRLRLGLDWNGPAVKLTGIEAQRDGAPVRGEIGIDLSSREARYDTTLLTPKM